MKIIGPIFIIYFFYQNKLPYTIIKINNETLLNLFKFLVFSLIGVVS
jgi:hypothetical protein